MKNAAISLTFALLVALAGTAARAADDPAATLAGILVTMNHFPDESQQATLLALAQDPSVPENLRTVALAIAHIEHQVASEYRAPLNVIAADAEAGDAGRTLAGAVLRFNHEAAAEDAEALKALAE